MIKIAAVCYGRDNSAYPIRKASGRRQFIVVQLPKLPESQFTYFLVELKIHLCTLIYIYGEIFNL